MKEAGAGMPMILVHGFPEDGGMWRKVAPALAEKFHVMVPDLPGSGKTALSEGLPTVEVMAEHLYTFIKQKNYRDICLVGHSMGGYVALAFLERHPELLHCVALVHSTSRADAEDRKEQRLKAAALLRNGDRDVKKDYLKTVVEKMYAPAYLEAHQSVYEEQLERASRMEKEMLARYNEALSQRPDRTEVLRNSKVPIQWIVGEKDQVLDAADIFELVGISSLSFLSLYKNCGHMSPIEAPERLVADLTRFGRFCGKS